MTARASPGALASAIAWTGGLLFVASLLFFLYAYLVRFSQPAAGPVGRAVIVDVLLFSTFALHHSLFARSALKHWVRRTVPPMLERSLYTWVASLLFLGVCWWWQPIPGVVYRIPPPISLIGIVMQLAGLLLTLRGSQAIDVLDLAGIRPVMRARTGETPVHVPLETRGVYAIVRHPLYFGWALLVFGATEMTATRFVFAAISCGYLALAIPWEERSLIETFGPDYEAYRRHVRWRMLPGLY